MAVITVDEVWRVALPAGTTLVAGESGLGREVNWTVRLRSRPPGFDVLQGGELAFVSTQSMRLLDETLTLASVLGHLNGMKAAAVAVAGDIDEEARDVADSLSLPLFVLPDETNLAAAEQSALRILVEWQSEVQRRAQDIQRQLTQLALDGRGLPAIVEKMALVTGKTALMEDASGQLRLFATPSDGSLSRQDAAEALVGSRAALKSWAASIRASASDPPVVELPLADGGLVRIVAPVVSRLGAIGYLSLIGPAPRKSDLDRMVVAHGAAACAIELARQQAALDAQDQVQIAFVDELLSRDNADLDTVRERAARLGYDLSTPHAALVFALPAEGGLESMALARALERELARRRIKAPVRVRPAAVSVLYPFANIPADSALKRAAEDLRSALAGATAQPALSAGLGRVYPGIEGIRAAHNEAEQALALGQRLLAGGRVIYFGDLGLYRLLFNIQERDQLRAFHDEMLGTLVKYDRENGAELVATLNAYFLYHNSPTEAAERMHVHRNTFLYRLHRIREITGLDLNDTETRLALHLALHIGDVLRAIEPGPRAMRAPSALPLAARSRRS